MQGPPTMQDIADRVGVARATVSLALSGKGRMSDETRERIRASAAEMNYVANSVARNLRSSRSGSIGLYIPDNPLSYPYYLEVLHGAVRRAQELDVLVTVVPAAVGERSRFEDHLDGFIVMDADDDDPMVERLTRGHRPVVSGEQIPPHLPQPKATVYSENRGGIRLLLDHVRARGARSPLCVFPPETMSWVREITAEFHAWADESAVVHRLLVLRDDVDAAEIGRLIVRRLQDDPEIDAVICAAEGAALIALESLRRAGRDDLLLASFIDSAALRVTSPSVTALDLDPDRIGRECVDALIEALAEPGAEQPTRRIEIPMTLRERESTARSARGAR